MPICVANRVMIRFASCTRRRSASMSTWTNSIESPGCFAYGAFAGLDGEPGDSRPFFSAIRRRDGPAGLLPRTGNSPYRRARLPRRPLSAPRSVLPKLPPRLWGGPGRSGLTRGAVFAVFLRNGTNPTRRGPRQASTHQAGDVMAGLRPRRTHTRDFAVPEPRRGARK